MSNFWHGGQTHCAFFGPNRPFMIASNATAQLHQTGHSCIVQHLYHCTFYKFFHNTSCGVQFRVANKRMIYAR